MLPLDGLSLIVWKRSIILLYNEAKNVFVLRKNLSISSLRLRFFVCKNLQTLVEFSRKIMCILKNNIIFVSNSSHFHPVYSFKILLLLHMHAHIITNSSQIFGERHVFDKSKRIFNVYKCL